MSGSTFRVRVVDETGSTNADLVAAGLAGEPHGAVVVARHQTAGRGRLDRRWDAPPGTNLLVSVLFRDGIDPLHAVTQRVGVAAAIACEGVAGVVVSLKWPNDLLVDGRKLGGILAEARPGFVVVGLGLNVGWAPPGAARLGDGVDPPAVLDALLDALAEVWAWDGASAWAAYRERLSTLGRAVRVELPQARVLEGIATDVEPDGRLVVRDAAGATHRVDSGDVIHLR